MNSTGNSPSRASPATICRITWSATRWFRACSTSSSGYGLNWVAFGRLPSIAFSGLTGLPPFPHRRTAHSANASGDAFCVTWQANTETGAPRSTRRQVESLSASATLTPDHVYRRVSGVVDGIFTRLDRDGDLHFESEFVYHALGLALVSRMERHEAGEDPTTVLDRFLDPIAGYDGRAEVMRAAVNITLLRHDAEPPTWLGALCIYWLHSQNLPEGHRDELGILAPELVTPMLDVIEASCGHPLTTPREIAISRAGSSRHG